MVTNQFETATAGQTMSDRTAIMGRPKKDEPTDQIRVPRSFSIKLRQLAIAARKDPGDYLVTEFGALLNKKHAKMLEDMTREAGKMEGRS